MLGALASLLLLAAAERPFAEERELLDRRLETLRRILPDGPNPGSDVAVVTELARGARLMGLEVLPRAPVENGAKGDVPIEVSAFGSYAEVDRFFRLAALSPRLVDVEILTLAAVPDGPVKVTALLRIPFRPLKAPLPVPPEGFRPRDPTVPRPQAEAYARDQMLAVVKSETIAALRRARRNPRLFLSEMAATARDRPVILTNASLGEEFSIRGLVLGEAPLKALETRFERGFFRILDFLITKRGACYRFEARGRSPVVGLDAEIPLPAQDPFLPEDAQCHADRDNGPAVLVRGPAGKIPGKGPLTLRLREVDLADVFAVLHDLTGEPFLVDEDVTGRINMDLVRVSRDEVLAALQKTGLRIAEGAGLLRVSRSGAAASPRPPLSVEATAPFRLAVKRAEVRDVLAAMAETDPGVASEAPAGSFGRLSVWARDVNLAALRAAVLEAAGLAERVEEGRRILARGQGSGEPTAPITSPPRRRLLVGPSDVGVGEFALAGLASVRDEWVAFAYSPLGALQEYRAGARLADGVVRAVQSTDVLLGTDEGELRVFLPEISAR
jgi:type IV pilus assembly PilO-like protein